ncbi:unnamed protein product [Symbiodinium natans]|uniref:Uncharacterized protein n=1 Tax=Symbiodinium natans TaxID=878477 RepID=A0A812M846_9DINO|nr:unnamed protein product [Symbiodinium natans]
MGSTSKGCGPPGRDQLIHDLSSCSTQVRDEIEGSLSHLVSVDDDLGGLESGGSIFSSASGRQPLVLLQLKRFASKGGHLSPDCKTRVQKAARHYDVLVEPGRQSFDTDGSRAFLEPGGPGYLPWLRSLRPKKASALRTRRPAGQTASPLQLVSLLPRSHQFHQPKQRKAAQRPRAPQLRRVHATGKQATDGRGALGEGPEEPFEEAPGEVNPDWTASRVSSGSPDIALPLPTTLEEEMANNVGIAGAAYTWPGPTRESSMRSPEASQSLGRVTGFTLPLPVRRGSEGEASRDSIFGDRRRSWARASSSISNFDRPRGKSAGFLNQRGQVREMVSAMAKL